MAYKSSPNSYFKKLPNLDYPSLQNDRTSVYDYQIVKNLFKRAVMRDDVYGSLVNFEKYSVQGDERPDQIAYEFYNDSALDWVYFNYKQYRTYKRRMANGESRFSNLFKSKIHWSRIN